MCILHTVPRSGARARPIRLRCSPGKWPDRIHEYSVPCISEIHSESVTRFISCIISRNSSLTHFRIDPPREQVRIGSSSWRGPPWPRGRQGPQVARRQAATCPDRGFIGRQPLRRRSPAPCRHRFKEKNTNTHLESQLPAPARMQINTRISHQYR